jgi:hypothetical protein
MAVAALDTGYVEPANPEDVKGTTVEVTQMPHAAGSALAVIAAMEAEPHVSIEDIAELRATIASGKRPAATVDPFARDTSNGNAWVRE